jgi:hypothetical protein
MCNSPRVVVQLVPLGVPVPFADDPQEAHHD